MRFTPALVGLIRQQVDTLTPRQVYALAIDGGGARLEAGIDLDADLSADACGRCLDALAGSISFAHRGLASECLPCHRCSLRLRVDDGDHECRSVMTTRDGAALTDRIQSAVARSSPQREKPGLDFSDETLTGTAEMSSRDRNGGACEDTCPNAGVPAETLIQAIQGALRARSERLFER